MKKRLCAVHCMVVLLFCMTAAVAAAAIIERPASFVEAPMQAVYSQQIDLAGDSEKTQEKGFFNQVQSAVMKESEDLFQVVVVYLVIFVLFALMVLQISGLFGALFWAAWMLVKKLLSKYSPKKLEKSDMQMQEGCPHGAVFGSNDETIRLKKANAIIYSYVKGSLKYFVKIYAPLLFITIPLYMIWWFSLCMKAFFWLVDERLESIKKLDQLLDDYNRRRYRSRLTGIMVFFIILLCWLAILILLFVVVIVLIFCNGLINELLE